METVQRMSLLPLASRPARMTSTASSAKPLTSSVAVTTAAMAAVGPTVQRYLTGDVELPGRRD